MGLKKILKNDMLLVLIYLNIIVSVWRWNQTELNHRIDRGILSGELKIDIKLLEGQKREGRLKLSQHGLQFIDKTKRGFSIPVNQGSSAGLMIND